MIINIEEEEKKERKPIKSFSTNTQAITKKERHTCAINVLIAKEKELKSYVFFLYK